MCGTECGRYACAASLAVKPPPTPLRRSRTVFNLASLKSYHHSHRLSPVTRRPSPPVMAESCEITAARRSPHAVRHNAARLSMASCQSSAVGLTCPWTVTVRSAAMTTHWLQPCGYRSARSHWLSSHPVALASLTSDGIHTPPRACRGTLQCSALDDDAPPPCRSTSSPCCQPIWPSFYDFFSVFCSAGGPIPAPCRLPRHWMVCLVAQVSTFYFYEPCVEVHAGLRPDNHFPSAVHPQAWPSGLGYITGPKDPKIRHASFRG